MKAKGFRLGQSSSLLVTTGGLWLLFGGMLLSLRLGSALMAGLCLFFLLLGLFSRWWGKRAIQNVALRITCSRKRLFPGQQTTLRYEVENNKFLPLVWLELSQNGPERDCLVPDDDFERYQPPGTEQEAAPPFLRQAFSFIGAHQTLSVESTWSARRRGIYLIDQLLARTGDGFGLVQQEQPLPTDQRPVLAVYPRQVEVDLSLFLTPQWDCVSGRRGWSEDNTVLRGSREYQAGDNWKHINWRMAAREQGLPVNLYETIQPRGMRFLLDGESFCGQENGLEHTLEVLASVLTGLTQAGISCSLTLPASRRFAAATLHCEDEDGLDELLFHLAGYDCLATPDPEVEQTAAAPVYLPSRFPAGAVSQTGTSFLITRSGAALPDSLLPQLDPGKVWVLSLVDCAAPEQLGLRGLPLDDLVKGGARP